MYRAGIMDCFTSSLPQVKKFTCGNFLKQTINLPRYLHSPHQIFSLTFMLSVMIAFTAQHTVAEAAAIAGQSEMSVKTDKFKGMVQLADGRGGFYMAGSNPYKRTYKKHSKYKKVPHKLGGKLPKNANIKRYNPDSDFEFYGDTYEPGGSKKLNKYRRTNTGTYRTMCVRVRDGFYWPISFTATKSQFKKDRIKCQKSCSDKVRLFYYPNPGKDIADMVDLKGKKYASLATAFLYRTKYVKEASCKPKPWSKEAKAKHQQYAVLDAEKKRKRHIVATRLAEKKRVASLRRHLRSKSKYKTRKYKRRVNKRRKSRYLRRRKRKRV